MNKGRRRSQQRNPKQGIRIEEKKRVVKPYNEDKDQNLPPPQQLDFTTIPKSEFIQHSLESAPKSNGCDPNQQPHVIEKTDSEVRLSVFDKEKQVGEDEVRESEKSKDEVNDILSRLEDIKLVAQEPTLEERLRVNDRLQEEEVNIYNSKTYFQLSYHNPSFGRYWHWRLYMVKMSLYLREKTAYDLSRFCKYPINIHIEVPHKFVVSTTKIDSFCGGVEYGGSGSETTIADNSNGFFYSFEIQYLPPIVLTCLLPKAYPSHCAPFTIYVQWLDVLRISSLCKMLDTIWTGQPGLPLASSEKADNVGDRRAISGSVSPDIPSLLNYNNDKCNEKFCQSLHESCICLSECAGTKFVRLPCKHFFCRNCMETYSTMHAKESMAILCPQIKCEELVPPGLVKSLLGDEKFEQWESLLFHKTLDSMSDLVYCPRCEMACLEDEDHLAQCPTCFFTFCGLCRDRLHIGVQCMTIAQDLAAETPKMTKQQRKELDMINQLLNADEIDRITKPCPKCSAPIARSEGCNHMRCTKCWQHFCYKCGGKYLRGPDSLCINNCPLFDYDHQKRQAEQSRQDEKLRQEHQREARMRQQAVMLLKEQQILHRRLVEDPENHAHSCPICHQINAKVQNNNHICCRSCEKHYCYLCRKIVKQSSQHYGPKGCKQHSAG
ncbi:hypothetical protein C5167_043586 [Papaver somniferum]|uniref:RBR-type E3 ubiquitin transferase n=1 Tax=Papaver somniferum TaxID=3469 RepID=A0A4Y7LA05_PAPSO|nr:hypothetical protein C5167_043586 [Papaver somniferum]